MDDERELELGAAESDVREEDDPGALYLYVPDLESATGWVSRRVHRAPEPSSRRIGFHRDEETR